MTNVTLNEKDVAGLEKKLKSPGLPKDEVAFIKFLLKKYKAAQKTKADGPKTKGGNWTFTWDGFSWSYKFG